MTSRLRIALVAHPRHPIAEPFKGGMEAHAFHLARTLMARGHDVTLFAAGDSDPRFRLDPVLPIHYDRDYPWENQSPHPELYTLLDHAFGNARHRIFSGCFDVVHNNSLHRYMLQEAFRTRQPAVTSLHVPPYEAIHHVVRATLCPTHCVTVTSARQNMTWWPEGIPPQSVTVHNGIDLGLWPFSGQSMGHVLWCGRITRNKGPHLALQAARHAGLAIRLFGYLEDESYFEKDIAPFLDAEHLYGGMLDSTALANEMQSAAVLAFTPCWDEPFGLVAAEAMSCGLPVAAFDCGAAREIIGEEAGRYASPGDIPSLAAALQAARTIGRHIPRRRAETCFSQARMIDRYEMLYKRVIAAGRDDRTDQETLM